MDCVVSAHSQKRSGVMGLIMYRFRECGRDECVEGAVSQGRDSPPSQILSKKIGSRGASTPITYRREGHWLFSGSTLSGYFKKVPEEKQGRNS